MKNVNVARFYTRYRVFRGYWEAKSHGTHQYNSTMYTTKYLAGFAYPLEA